MQAFYEKKARGTVDFPFALYHESVSNVSVQYHYHPEIEAVYNVSGEYTLTVGGREYSARAGDIFFINSDELHAMNKNRGDVEFYSIVFHSHILDFENKNPFQRGSIEPIKNGSLSLPHRIKKDCPYYEDIKTQFERIIKADSKFYCAERLIALYEMIITLQKNNALLASAKLRGEDKNIRVIKKISKYVNSNLGRKITLSDLSREAEMSEKYFCSFFKKLTGNTPLEFVNKTRIESACEMLRNENQSITEVALDCGFESLSYFIRRFKEQMGVSPNEYKKREKTQTF